MLKRLIIAVFGISLVLAFGSLALADQYHQPAADIQKTSFIPNHPKLNAVEDIRPGPPQFRLNPGDHSTPLPSNAGPLSAPSLVYFCDLQDYSGGPYYAWVLPDPDLDLYNTRFTVEAGFDCTLKVAHVALYEPFFAGSPGMRVYLWADDGFGLPGALLDSVDVSNATILSYTLGSLAYVPADFSASGWVFSDGDSYHYGVTVLGGVGDTICFTSDDGLGPNAGDERSGAYYSGAFYSNLALFGADDYVFDIVSERCCSEIPFSDCYTQSYWDGVAYSALRLPHPIYGDSAFAMRFDVGGPETLQSVDVGIYFLDNTGANDVRVTVYDDDGSGFPGTMLAQEVILGGTYPGYPALANAVFSPTLVLQNTFHIAISTSGIPGSTYERLILDDAAGAAARSTGSGDPTWPGPGTWYTMLAWWGADYSFLINANLCRDEFSDCETQNWLGPFFDANYPIPELTANGTSSWAQKFTNAPGGAECEVRELTVHLARNGSDVGLRPLMYTFNTLIHVALDDGTGHPGAIVHTETLTPADYAAAGYTGDPFVGNMFFTRSTNVPVPSTFWVIVESLAPSRATGIRLSMNLTGGGGFVDGLAVYDTGIIYGPPAAWYLAALEYFLGASADWAADISAQVCCVPFTGRACAPPDDWSNRSHDLGRSGASQLAIGDAWCDLTVDWLYDDVDGNTTAQTMGPVIYDGRVYQVVETGSVGSRIRVFDLATGALVYTITLAAPANFVENDPLIVGGNLYIAGGDSRVISKYDITTTPATFTWATAPLPAAGGPMRRANLMLVNVAGTDVLFGGTQLGRAFAVDAGTGAMYAGWATNPITLDAGQLVQGSATNGGLLYFATRLSGFDGDIWAINPADGSTSWKLSTAGGRQGASTVFPGTGNPILTEGFTSLSTEGPVLYAGSNCQTANFPADGVFYRLDAGTGALLSASQSNAFLFANPIIDINLVYCQGTTRWVGNSMGGDMTAYNKLTGALAWVSEYYVEDITPSNNIARYFANGLLTCEPEPAIDLIVNQDERGILHCWNSLDGTEIFRRNWDYGGGTQNIADGTAIGTDTSGAVHILGGVFRGSLVSLSKGDDRPRLELQDIDPAIAVEFSVSTSVIYSVPNILTNTGCADLTFAAVNVDTASFGPTDWGLSPFVPVKPGLLDVTTSIAEQMTSKASLFIKEANEINSVEESMVSLTDESYRNERGYRAALYTPAYLNGVLEPWAGEMVAAGDSIPLTLDVNASMITRGPQTFYIELVTDDPDYYVNTGSPNLPNVSPELIVTLVGGCLLDSTSLEFGVGSANYQFVFNDGFLSESSGPFGFNIDGDDDAVWMGTYIFGVSQHRLALSIHYSGFNFISWQADPNWCDNDCKPALTTGVSLGAIWNGASYTPISGNMVCASGVDSVQNMGSPWDWDAAGPFDGDSTMGLYVNTRTIGAVDEPALASLTVEILEFTERNGNSIPGWKFGMWADLDIFVNSPVGTGKDTARVALDHSAAWHSEIGGSTAWGLIKLPYGCGHPTLKNAYLLDSDNSMYASGGTAAYMDQFYAYCSLGPGLYGMPGASAARDQSTHMTVVEHDFTPNETFDFGIGFFGLHGISTTPAGQATAVRNLADLTNKWVGFGRGDVNDDELINLSDVMTLADIVGGSVPGAIPFAHLGDVDADNDVDNADLNYLINYYFGCGPCPLGEWQF